MLFVIQHMQAQLTSFGPVEQLGTGRKVSFHNNHLYAATSQGLYMREVDNSESGWEKLPLTDYAVKDFAVRGDTVIALTDTLLFVSTDGGETAKSISIDVIAPGWRDNPHYNEEAVFGSIRLRGLALHPADARRFYVAYRGLSYTEDGGTNWSIIEGTPFLEGLYYNPIDANNLIAYSNESVTANSMAKVYTSTDGGYTWDNSIGYVGGSITYFRDIAFHPADKNRLIMCGESILAISADQGKSWEKIGKEPVNPDMGITPLVHLNSITYDPRNSEVIYGADLTTPKVRILRSADGGFSWNPFYTFGSQGRCTVQSICIYENQLAICTSTAGIYLLDVDAVETSISSTENAKASSTPHYDLQGRPVSNPTRGIYIRDGKKVVIK